MTKQKILPKKIRVIPPILFCFIIFIPVNTINKNRIKPKNNKKRIIFFL